MADNETELPEGTDKIINGASDTGDGANGGGGAENEAGPDELISGNSDGTALTGRGGNASGGGSSSPRLRAGSRRPARRGSSCPSWRWGSFPARGAACR